MTGGPALATATRLLLQARRHPGPVAVLLAGPAAALPAVRWTVVGGAVGFEQAAGPLLALLPFLAMLVGGAAVTVRERDAGTLERLLAGPASAAHLVAGHAAALAAAAAVQAVLAVAVAQALLRRGAGTGPLLLTVWLCAVLGAAMGLLVGTWARDRGQAVWLVPAVAVPQLLLCAPPDRGDTASAVQALAGALPLGYGLESATSLVGSGGAAAGAAAGTAAAGNLLALGTGAVLALVLAAATTRRQRRWAAAP